jgi:hypothetical protein
VHSALSGVVFCLDFSPFLFLLLFPCQVFFFYLFTYDKLDENLPNIHKTKHPKKKGREKGTRWMDPSPSQKKKPPTRVDCKGNKIKSSTQPSSEARSI